MKNNRSGEMRKFSDFSFYNKTWFRIESQSCLIIVLKIYITKKYSKDKPWVVELDTGFI